MRDISMKKHSLISTILVTALLRPVLRSKSTTSCVNVKCLSIKKIDTSKSGTQQVGCSSFQVAASSLESDLIKSMKLVRNFQKKITQGVWTKINELAFERHSYFDDKQSVPSLASSSF